MGCTALLCSCGTPFPLGCLYTKVTLPVALGNGDIKYNRVGYATVNNFLGFFASGDASISTAAASAQITKVSWVSQKVENFLGIYGTFTTIVYGFGETADESVAPETVLEN